MSVSSQMVDLTGQNRRRTIRSHPVVCHIMLIMLAVIVALSALSLFSMADIRPTGGLIEYIHTYSPFIFVGLIIINLVFILALRTAKFLLFIFASFLVLISLMSADVSFLSDKIWTNIYMNFEISPGYGGRSKPLKQLSESQDSENMCANTVIGRRAYGAPDDLPFNDLCAFLYRDWLTIFQACSVEIVYIRNESKSFKNAKNIFKILIERKTKMQTGGYLYYYAPPNSGVLMYKSCYPITL